MHLGRPGAFPGPASHDGSGHEAGPPAYEHEGPTWALKTTPAAASSEASHCLDVEDTFGDGGSYATLPMSSSSVARRVRYEGGRHVDEVVADLVEDMPLEAFERSNALVEPAGTLAVGICRLRLGEVNHSAASGAQGTLVISGTGVGRPDGNSTRRSRPGANSRRGGWVRLMACRNATVTAGSTSVARSTLRM